MPHNPDQILTVAQMRAAEEALIAAGSSAVQLMQIAGRGAAEYVWRVAANRKVTVLCGPGNNGGDGYVIAEALRERGGKVTVVAASTPGSDAAKQARTQYQGEVVGPDADVRGDVLVDCLFGSGLTRPLGDDLVALLTRLADHHPARIAIDVPSGVQSDSGNLLNEGLPDYELTLALGAWKLAHFLMPANGVMGTLRLVDIGCGAVNGAVQALGRPNISSPPTDWHKYRRGLLMVFDGEMPGAAVLAASAAQGAGAGYVKLITERERMAPPDLVAQSIPVAEALADRRITALLIGPGLGRSAAARRRLVPVLASPVPCVLDADGLHLIGSRKSTGTIATPHDGELTMLERTFGLSGAGSKVDRAINMARASGMVIVAKGPDTVVAAPDGRIACTAGASSWLSTAGTGDVLAGIIASRLATRMDLFQAACEGVWLHGEAARLSDPGFTAGHLAKRVSSALAACL
jgi:ADP-dependent NAD(P)H-hydrate dehydratase / NAD(P)H-hydrate epimerase